MRSDGSGYTAKLTILCILLFGAAACSVVESVALVDNVDGRATGTIPVACQSSLGSYSLPKSLVNITVTSKGPGQNEIVLAGVPTRVPENRFTFCLDHLINGFADDSIRVVKTKPGDASANAASTASPFLTLVASHASDQSAEIIRKLILTAFRILSVNPQFKNARAAVGASEGTDEVLRDLTFDPFDQKEVAEINSTLSPLGFCVVLEDFSFDVYQQNVGKYCSNPKSISVTFPSKKATALKAQRYLVPKPTSGIFYRPRADHAVSVYVKSDPGAIEPWRLQERKWMAFENASPILSIGVGRAQFATRRTGLIFDEGMLKNVCVAKGSEIAGFVGIPLDIIYGVIALPGQTIRGTINRFDTRRQLIEAQEALVDAQQAYIDYLSTPGNLADPSISTDKGGKLTLGKIPSPNESELTVYSDRLNGNTNSIGEDAVLADICDKLTEADKKYYIAAEQF